MYYRIYFLKRKSYSFGTCETIIYICLITVFYSIPLHTNVVGKSNTTFENRPKSSMISWTKIMIKQFHWVTLDVSAASCLVASPHPTTISPLLPSHGTWVRHTSS